MKTLLIFPPPWEPTAPYSSLPSLAAFLRRDGLDVEIRDLNIEATDWMLSREGLMAAHELCARRLRGPNPADERALVESLQLTPVLLEGIEQAKSVMRDPDTFYDPTSYRWALGVISGARQLHALAARPSPAVARGSRGGANGFVKRALALGDVPLRRYYEDLALNSLLAGEPGIVGISVPSTSQLEQALVLAHLLKGRVPDIHVTLGGPAVTDRWQILADCRALFTSVDSLVVSDGETPLRDLVDRLSTGRDLEGVSNLVRPQGNGPVVEQDVDGLPTPSYEGLPLDRYLSPHPVLSVFTSRRCYWGRCAFCSGFGSACDTTRRNLRRASRVVDDMETLAKTHRTKYFAFYDGAVAPAVLRRVAKQIVERRLDVAWYCYARFEKQYTAELCDLLAAAGCKKLRFGLESAHPRVLDLMRKGTRPATVRKVLENCFRAGIVASTSCVTGFPTETREEANETLDFLLRNEKILPPYFFGCFNPFQLKTHSAVWKDPSLFGVTRIHRPKGIDTVHSYSVSTGITQREAATLSKELTLRLREGLRGKVFGHTLDVRSHPLLYVSHYGFRMPPGAEGPRKRTVKWKQSYRMVPSVVLRPLSHDEFMAYTHRSAPDLWVSLDTAALKLLSFFSVPRTAQQAYDHFREEFGLSKPEFGATLGDLLGHELVEPSEGRRAKRKS